MKGNPWLSQNPFPTCRTRKSKENQPELLAMASQIDQTPKGLMLPETLNGTVDQNEGVNSEGDEFMFQLCGCCGI